VAFAAADGRGDERLLVSDNKKYKTYVIRDGGDICGYVSVRAFKEREAYGDTAEIGIYLKENFCGKGYGGAALRFIESHAENAGLHVLIATISCENAGSIRLFEKNGYIKCAYFKEVGRKFGRLLDAVAYQKILN
jgi:phosphinothricin acetyltransferase